MKKILVIQLSKWQSFRCQEHHQTKDPIDMMIWIDVSLGVFIQCDDFTGKDLSGEKMDQSGNCSRKISLSRNGAHSFQIKRLNRTTSSIFVCWLPQASVSLSDPIDSCCATFCLFVLVF